MSENIETLRPGRMRDASATVRRGLRGGRSIRRAGSDFAVGAALPVAVVAAWQLAGDAGLIDPFFLPTPLAILEAFRDLFVSGDLARHLGISVRRAAVGFLFGGGLGLLLGLLAGFNRRAEYVLDPSMQMLRMIPHLAIAPLVILWFGFGETSKIILIAKGAFFPLYINTLSGIRGVDDKLVQVSRILEFDRRTRLARLMIPAAMPGILLGLRLSLALSWLGLVVAELLGSTDGVGFLINAAKQNGTTEIIFAGIVIFAVVGKLLDSFVRLLERRLLRWRDSYHG